jgi:serine/threonine protein phosphatase PrpC
MRAASAVLRRGARAASFAAASLYAAAPSAEPLASAAPRSHIFSQYARAPPPPVGPLPLPQESLEAGGVGPRGAAGGAAYGRWFVSAASYPANAPVEDRFDVATTAAGAAATLAAPGGGLLAAVFDGHGGWQAAEHARRTLLSAVAAELDAGGGGSGDAEADSARVGAALARAFVKTDATFIDAVRPAFALGFGELAHVGACAIAAYVTPTHVVVANAGDCRAVLGRIAFSGGGGGGAAAAAVSSAGDADLGDGHAAAAAALVDGGGAAARAVPSGVDAARGAPYTLLPEPPASRWHALATNDVGVAGAFGDAGKRGGDADAALPAAPPPRAPARLFFTAVPMSLDHNAREPRERARLAAEHPGEPDIVVCKKDAPTACYVKARLQPTRALGDAYLKAAEFNTPKGAGRQWGRHIREPYTPPYISSVPEVRVQGAAAARAPGARSGGAGGVAAWLAAFFSAAPAAAAAPTDAGADGAFLILACDGVWDVLTNEEAAGFVARNVAAAAAAAGDAAAAARAAGADDAAARAAARAAAAAHLSGTAERLSVYVLARSAAEEGVSTRQLLNLKPGKGGRRDVHDDITIITTFLGGVDGVVRLALDGA